MTEQDHKTMRAIAWAVCVVLSTLIASINGYWAVRDVAAIKAGLVQSATKSETGGYWIREATP